MKIMASKREYPTYDDYAASGKFSMGQLTILKLAFSMGEPPKLISLLANPEFTEAQMNSIFYAIDLKVSLRELSLYADPSFSTEQMEVLTHYARYGQGGDFPISELEKMANPNLSPVEMTAIGVSSLRNFTDEQYHHLLNLLERYQITRPQDVYDYVSAARYNLSTEQADLVYKSNLDQYQKEVVLDGFICGLPYEQVKLYADPKIESGKMDELRIALSNGAPIDDIVDFLSDEYSQYDVRDYCYDMGYYAYNEDDDDWEDE